MLYKAKKRLIIIKAFLFIYHLHGFIFRVESEPSQPGRRDGSWRGGGDAMKGGGETLEEKRGRRLGLSCV